MKRNKNKLLLIAVIISILGAFISLFFMDGQEVGLASLITIFVTGFAGGASLTAYVSGVRKENTKNM